MKQRKGEQTLPSERRTAPERGLTKPLGRWTEPPATETRHRLSMCLLREVEKEEPLSLYSLAIFFREVV